MNRETIRTRIEQIGIIPAIRVSPADYQIVREARSQNAM